MFGHRFAIIAAALAAVIAAAALAPAVGLAGPPPPAGPGAAAAPGESVAPASVHWAANAARWLGWALGWQPPADLDAPIDPAAWNGLVALLADVQPGPASRDEDARRYWIWTYTGAMAEGPTIARQDAIGGLMKILNMLYRVDLSGDADTMQPLRRFSDGGGVSDRQSALVAIAISEGLVAGYPDGWLRPAEPLTGGEAAALVARVLTRYGGAQPPPADRPEAPVAKPDATAAPGAGDGWAAALVRPDGVMSRGEPTSVPGVTAITLHGAAWASALPKVGPAPPGHLWVLLDVEIGNQSGDQSLPLSGWLDFGLEDPLQALFRYEAHAEATSVLGSPFGRTDQSLAPGETARGLVAFAVPAGTKGIWYHVRSKLGLGAGKEGWNSGARGPAGDLPGPERVYPYGTGPRDGPVRVEGRYATAVDAAAVTAGARARGTPAWIEAEPDGGYTAIVGIQDSNP